MNCTTHLTVVVSPSAPSDTENSASANVNSVLPGGGIRDARLGICEAPHGTQVSMEQHMAGTHVYLLETY
jgi:hypothetical protein